MANQRETLVVNAPIKSPADKFHSFFKFNMTQLVKIFPAGFTSAEVVEGVEGAVGNVILWSYVLGGAATAKVKTTAIDDVAKSITWVVIEGAPLLLYKYFSLTLSVSEGLAEWSYEYEKATALAPPPELYTPLAITATALVDAYLILNS